MATISKTSSAPEKSPPKSADAIQLLVKDHGEVKTWFDKYEELEDDGEKTELAGKICAALTVHTQIEEEIFYPSCRENLDEEDLLDEAEVEHDGAKRLIAEIEEMTAGDDLYDAKVKVLGEYVKHHIKEEETELFPAAKQSDMDLAALGEEMAARKDELMQEADAEDTEEEDEDNDNAK